MKINFAISTACCGSLVGIAPAAYCRVGFCRKPLTGRLVWATSSQVRQLYLHLESENARTRRAILLPSSARRDRRSTDEKATADSNARPGDRVRVMASNASQKTSR